MNIGKNMQQSFDFYFKNFGTLLVASLIAGLISIVSLGILAGPLVGGVLLLGLKLLRGEKGEFNEIFAHLDQFVPTFITTLLFGLVSLVLWIVGIIPVIGWVINLGLGPLVGLAYFLSIGFIVEQKMRPIEAVKRSIDCLAADPLMLWIYSLVMIILGGIGSILFVVGVILTMPLVMMGMSVAYQQLSAKETPLFKPEKGILQIVGISLAVLVVAGALCLTLGIGRNFMHRSNTNMAAKILSGMTGQKIKIDEKNDEIKNFKIGDMSFGSGLPENFPKDVPIYPKAEIGGYLGGKDGKVSGSTTTLTSNDSISDIYTYYTTNLEKRGWAVTTSDLGEIKMVNFKKDQRAGVVTINKTDSKCDILIVITSE